MDDSSLDDQLKQAQIEKTRAESKKLDREGEAVLKSVDSSFWSEALKILGAAVLGLGGIIAAYTQYEVAELKAKIANQDLTRAEEARKAAVKEGEEAAAKRDLAIRERKEAETAIKELKTSLETLTTKIRIAQPNLITNRLVYVQFRGSITRETINGLRDFLHSKGFNAPGAERISGSYENVVKYFDKGDADIAERLATETRAFFRANHCPVNLRTEGISGASAKTSALELWLVPPCN